MKNNDISNKNLENAIGELKPIPFYFLNDDVDREEIVIQLECMKDNGISAFFLHVRDGILNQAFGTDVFFENVKFIVEQAASRGIKVWLYDEDAYPSGNCGGITAFERPELQLYSFVVERVDVDEEGYARQVLGEVKGMYGYVVKTVDGKENVQVHENCFGSVRRRWYKRVLNKHYFSDMADKAFPHLRGSTNYSEIMFELKAEPNAEVYCAYLKPLHVDNRFSLYANLLDRRATEFFINKVHENYRKYVGEYFGTVIPGIFLDEPAVISNGYVDGFDEYFENKFGYNPKQHFYKLSADYEGDGKKFRKDYARTINSLFEENFLTPIKEWCDSNGLLLTGHFSGEENVASQARAVNIASATKLMDIPGVDLIGNDVGDLAHSSLIVGAKIATSAAWQSGKDVVLCEAFALNPHNFGYQGMKLNADWLFSLGVNLIVPHGLFYGYSAFQRSDAGKSFFFQDRLFGDYLKFSEYAGRVCNLLHKYRAQNDVLLVAPLGICAEEVLTARRNQLPTLPQRTKDAIDRLSDITKLLCLCHVNWDIAYTTDVLAGICENGAVVIGERRYKKVIVVAGGDEELSAYKKLEGNVENVNYCTFPNSIRFPDKLISCIEGDARQLLVLKKVSENGKLYFIFNNCKEFARFKFNVDERLSVYDAENDKYLHVNKNKDFAINGYGSLILVTDNVDCIDKYVPAEKTVVTLEYKENPQIVYMPNGAEFVITDFDLEVIDKGEKREYKSVGFSRLRDILGTDDSIYKEVNHLIPYFDTAPRMVAPYPVYAKYSTVLDKHDGGILFDKGAIDGDFKIYFNGKLIEKSEISKKRIYDASNVIFYPDWKDKNILEIVFENGTEFDGINGEIFVMNKDI